MTPDIAPICPYK